MFGKRRMFTFIGKPTVKTEAQKRAELSETKTEILPLGTIEDNPLPH
jgi:hypothetical protein